MEGGQTGLFTARIRMMTPTGFFASTQNDSAPPADTPPALQALWYAQRGEWDRAHGIAQDIETPEGAWVHAHLHRVEGDDSNAGYWYARAGRPHSTLSLPEEWKALVEALLKD